MGRISKEAQLRASATKFKNGKKLDSDRGYLKKCSTCETIAFNIDDLEKFVKASSCRHGRANTCKKCKRSNRKPDEDRRSSYRRTYGITIEDYDKMFLYQKGKCAICSSTKPSGNGKRLHVDHCHTTGEIRGLLCGNCNTGLGLFKDNRKNLALAIAYLNKGE